MNDLEAKVAAMSLEECRARLAEISALSKIGDYSWDFDEYCYLTTKVPEERVAREKAAERSRKAAARRYRRLTK